MRALLLPKVQLQPGLLPGPKENRRLGDALFPHAPQTDAPEPPPREEIEFDATLTVSDRELLRRADFDTMTADEWRAARRAIERLRPDFERLRTRRWRPASRPGRLDWRATLRASARQDVPAPRWRLPREKAVPLVVLADISGSMSRYSRMLLHFTHALAAADVRVESFVFGTRLTRITRLLARRDPDVAIGDVMRTVEDWSGGTRITASLQAFHRDWARRTLPGTATVLLVSDGLEVADAPSLAALDAEMAHLRRLCRRLLWLNPLLRFRDFRPEAGGVRAMLPHVSGFMPVHNLESLDQLVGALGPMRR